MTDPDSKRGKLELNTRGHRHDPTLERAADLFHTDRAAWDRLPASIRSQSDVYADLRQHHRDAVAAGVIRRPRTVRGMSTTKESTMPSKTPLPTREEVEAQAAEVAAQLDAFRQQDQLQAAEDHRRKVAAQLEFDERLVAGFSRAEVEAEVGRARAALDDALAANHLVLALADYLASLRRRSHAMHEHMATLGRLGRPTAPPNAGPTELYDLEGTIFRAAERIAADRVAAEQTDLHARRDAAGDNPKESRS